MGREGASTVVASQEVVSTSDEIQTSTNPASHTSSDPEPSVAADSVTLDVPDGWEVLEAGSTRSTALDADDDDWAEARDAA